MIVILVILILLSLITITNYLFLKIKNLMKELTTKENHNEKESNKSKISKKTI